MKKLLLISSLCLITNVYAQNTSVVNEKVIPKDSFTKSVTTTNNPEVYKLNTNTPISNINNNNVSNSVSSNNTNSNTTNTTASNTVPNTNNPITPNNPQNNTTIINISPDAKLVEMQKYSSQSNADYLKRRNNEFEGGMSQCINKIPKNSRGERSSDELIKCANNKK